MVIRRKDLPFRLVKMNVLVVISLIVIGAVQTQARGDHNSHFCYSCDHVANPLLCNQVERCLRGSHCGMEVRHDAHGALSFKMGCIDGHTCDLHLAPQIGKRQHHHGGEPKPLCAECCDTEYCNKKVCATYVNQFTAPSQAPTTAGTGPIVTSGTGTGVQIGTGATCRDHEEDGFSCALFSTSICTETDPTKYSYILAHSKCPQFCGYCDIHGNVIKPSQNPDPAPTVIDVASTVVGVTATTEKIIYTDATTTVAAAKACVDDETNGFLCSNFDLFNFCTDTTNFAYPLAQEKCPKHCGFCTDTTIA